MDTPELGLYIALAFAPGRPPPLDHAPEFIIAYSAEEARAIFLAREQGNVQAAIIKVPTTFMYEPASSTIAEFYRLQLVPLREDEGEPAAPSDWNKNL